MTYNGRLWSVLDEELVKFDIEPGKPHVSPRQLVFGDLVDPSDLSRLGLIEVSRTYITRHVYDWTPIGQIRLGWRQREMLFKVREQMLEKRDGLIAMRPADWSRLRRLAELHLVEIHAKRNNHWIAHVFLTEDGWDLAECLWSEVNRPVILKPSLV